MRLIRRRDVEGRRLPGRLLQLVVGGEGAASPSVALTMGFAHYSIESGVMEPHRHAEEIVLVLGTRDGWTRHGGFGDEPNEMCGPIPLEAGMILHVPDSEWHVFGFEEGGHVDIAFFYGRADIYSRARS